MNRYTGCVLAFAFAVACGFRVPPALAASESVLYSFCSQDFCLDGNSPGTILSVQGMLYGTTFGGGNTDCVEAISCGTAFSFNPQTGVFSSLYSFCSQQRCADGYDPTGLDRARDKLYGLTFYGGGGHCEQGCGTVFSIDPVTGAERVAYKFDGGSDGISPIGSMLRVNHILYGVTAGGGLYGLGTVFSFDPHTGSETVLHSFSGATADGSFPVGGLTDINGTLYGITQYGGAGNCESGCGTVFSVNPSTGAEKIVHSFSNGGDGVYASGALIRAQGILYGTTLEGGAVGYGSVFAINPATGSETILYSFAGGSDGDGPEAKLLYKNGELYGTTYQGGGSSLCYQGCGTVFSVNIANATETVLHTFGNSAGDGQAPAAAVIMLDGTLYGTTEGGGAYGYGTIFALTP